MSTNNNATSQQELALELLNEYDRAAQVVEEAKRSLDAANKARSEVVKKIYNKIGKGPFEYQDKYLGKIAVRGNTYFFRGKGDEDTIKVG